MDTYPNQRHRAEDSVVIRPHEAGELLEVREGFSCSLSRKILVPVKLVGELVWIVLFPLEVW